MIQNPLLEWLPEVAADRVVVRPGDIDAEAQGNLWSFSLTGDQAAALAPSDVTRFAMQVIDSRRLQLVRGGYPPMRIYWWHDEQAAQLRFSLVSATRQSLPFGCEVLPASSLDTIARAWLNPTQQTVSWEELEPVPFSESTHDELPYVLPVWAAQIP